MTERKMNPNSLENLKMGAIANNQGKIRVTLTLLPESIKWLKASGNMSERIDYMIDKIVKGELVGKSKLDDALAKIKKLEDEINKG